MTISFEDALAMQDELQSQTYGKSLTELDFREAGPIVLLHVTAAVDELHEVMRETNWKPWKKSAVANIDAYREEMVDAFHFFMNLMLIGGMTAEDLLNGYAKKHAVNIERQSSGY